jgi:hypothetical protein
LKPAGFCEMVHRERSATKSALCWTSNRRRNEPRFHFPADGALAPVLMLGAGLFLAGTKTGRDATQKASNVASDLSEEALRRSRELRDQVEDSASAASVRDKQNRRPHRIGVERR